MVAVAEAYPAVEAYPVVEAYPALEAYPVVEAYPAVEVELVVVVMVRRLVPPPARAGGWPSPIRARTPLLAAAIVVVEAEMAVAVGMEVRILVSGPHRPIASDS